MRERGREEVEDRIVRGRRVGRAWQGERERAERELKGSRKGEREIERERERDRDRDRDREKGGEGEKLSRRLKENT